ncbi:MAG TPA: right-handed parallel beta-helix repeat-containing protein [Thermomicrobiaceae bacterium]|nr:right-handed parallel beta-helix repeat-containing protein [Thermomicrobiaceae bacterium]
MAGRGQRTLCRYPSPLARRALLLAAALALLLTGCRTGTRPPVPAPTTIQQMVDAAAPGSVVAVPPGIYRETVTITKPLTLVGRPGAEIRGSDLWTSWTPSGRVWLGGTLPDFPHRTVPCLASSNGRCGWPEQVFFDGRPLFQVGGDPGPGQFAISSTRRLILGENPAGHTVEVTTRQHWIVGAAPDVTIEGFTMRDAASPPQEGAIENNGYANWTVERNTLSDAAGAVIFLRGASGLRVLHNDIARGGQEGISLDQTRGAALEDNTIHDNNTEEFDPTWEAGGVKITRSTGTVVSGNVIDQNFGAGLWFDIGCVGATVTGNRVHDNADTGISYEVSHDGTISGNAVWENGWGDPSTLGAAGILLSSADHTVVSQNVLAWNVSGVTVLSQRRADASPVVDDVVRDNVIAATDDFSPGNRFALRWVEDYPGMLYRPASNNQGLDNRFWSPATAASVPRFHWTTDLADLAAFAQTPGGRGSTSLTATQKDQLLGAAGVPTVEEHR